MFYLFNVIGKYCKSFTVLEKTEGTLERIWTNWCLGFVESIDQISQNQYPRRSGNWLHLSLLKSLLIGWMAAINFVPNLIYV